MTRPIPPPDQPVQQRPERPAGPHVPTLVLGVVLAAVAGLVTLGELTDVRVDLGLVLPLGMIALGALLVAAALVTGFRRRG